MVLPQPKVWVSEIPAYEAGKSQIKGTARPIKLSSNEAAFGPSPHALAAYAQAQRVLHRYPPGDSHDLRAAIAAQHGLDPAQLICGAGSDELIALLCRAYAGPGDEVIHTRHGFLIYSIYARSVGATPVAAAETNLTADVDAILAAATERTRLVFLANPNNPTGTYISGSDLLRLRSGLREDILLVLDDAYAEFADAPDYQSGLGLAGTTPNTVVLRTFSKIYGLAALRLGWGYGAQAIVEAMERFRAPFNVSRPAQLAGVAAIRDQDHIAKAKAHNAKWRKVAVQRLRALGLKIGDTAANFVLPEFPAAPGRSAADADTYLQSHGIVVRCVEPYGLPNHLRITIGNDDEMTAVLDALTAFVERGDA